MASANGSAPPARLATTTIGVQALLAASSVAICLRRAKGSGLPEDGKRVRTGAI